MEKDLHRENEIEKNTPGNNGYAESSFDYKTAQLKNGGIRIK